MEARAGEAQLLPAPAPATAVLGFRGSDATAPSERDVIRAPYGPVLHYEQNDALFVRFVNKTEEPLSVHWHGMRGDNAADGVVPLTQAPVAPGASFDYRRVLEDSGLFCYRPSVFPRTGELMARGLKGLLVVEEPSPLHSDAELVVLLDDWLLPFRDVGGDPLKLLGIPSPLLTVNGASTPAIHEYAPGARVRLRLANLANAENHGVVLRGGETLCHRD